MVRSSKTFTLLDVRAFLAGAAAATCIIHISIPTECQNSQRTSMHVGIAAYVYVNKDLSRKKEKQCIYILASHTDKESASAGAHFCGLFGRSHVVEVGAVKLRAHGEKMNLAVRAAG
jgi:hypothetical protein